MCPSPDGFIGIGGEGGVGIGASPQQPIFMLPSMGMPPSIGGIPPRFPIMGAGFMAPGLIPSMPDGTPPSIAPDLPMPFIAGFAALSPVAGAAAAMGGSAGLIPGIPGCMLPLVAAPCAG